MQPRIQVEEVTHRVRAVSSIVRPSTRAGLSRTGTGACSERGTCRLRPTPPPPDLRFRQRFEADARVGGQSFDRGAGDPVRTQDDVPLREFREDLPVQPFRDGTVPRFAEEERQAFFHPGQNASATAARARRRIWFASCRARFMLRSRTLSASLAVASRTSGSTVSAFFRASSVIFTASSRARARIPSSASLPSGSGAGSALRIPPWPPLTSAS